MSLNADLKKIKNPKQHNVNGSESNGSKANTRATIRLEKAPSDIYIQQTMRMALSQSSMPES
jgi:hypothetical protein